MKPKIIVIVAAAQGNRVIGKADNQIPWPRIKGDMNHFKDLTTGHPVIMGRVTFETMRIVDGVIQPLPQRQNIVITRNPEYVVPPNVWIADSLENAIRQACTIEENLIYIIGGQQIYEMALPVADEIFYSRIGLDVEGTTRFPKIPSQFTLSSEKDMKQEDVKFPDGTLLPVEYQIQHWILK